MASSGAAAFHGLACAVCAEPAHGRHFNVIACRPCAAFFRRCTVEKLNYRCLRVTNCCTVKIGTRKQCKACRFQMCQRAGMKLDGTRGGGGGGHGESSSGTTNLAPSLQMDHQDEQDELLANFMVAHNQLMAQQRALFLRLRPENVPKTVTLFIPETDLVLRHFEQASRPMFIDMLNKALPPFAKLDHGVKQSLFADCFEQLNFLHVFFLSMEYFAWEGDHYFLIAFGLVMDWNLLEEILAQWAASPHILVDPAKYLMIKRNEMRKKFHFIQLLKQQPQKMSQRDLCALIATMVCIKALPYAQEDAAEWEWYRAIVSRQWLHSLTTSPFRHTSEFQASLHMARLLAALHQLDLLCANLAKMPTEAISSDSLQQFSAADNFMAKIGKESSELAFFSRLSTCYHRIWAAFAEFDDGFLDKFTKLDDLLTGSDNILGFAQTFTADPPPMAIPERDEFFSELSQMYTRHQYHPRIMKSTIVFRLLAIGILKAMPAFRHLITQEKTKMVRQLRLPINFFVNSFFSARLGFDTWAGQDRLTSMEIFRAVPEYKKDERFMQLSENAFTRAVEPFLRVPMLKEEEFALLLAILCSHSVADLSEHSRDLLYAQQTYYSKLLFKYLQMRLGHEAGAKRYAECMHLLSSSFGSANNFELFIIYMETFHMRHGYSLGFPKSISAIV